jgi:hypothetical protein
MPLDVPHLQTLTPDELDEVFKQSPAGELPDGEADGTVLVAPGTNLAEPVAKLVHFIAWQGKVFDRERGELRNEIGPLGLQAIRAKVYRDTSWFDGGEAIILDYSKTSIVAQWIRDEIREVSPRVYLGLVFWEQAKVLHFALDFGA